MDADNAPYSIKSPPGWDQVIAYSNGGAKPDRASAQKTFDQLLKNIRLEQCAFYPDVVNALFHRVPGRVEAENYGGTNPSYFVKDTAQRSKYYRPAEPVPVEQVEAEGNRWRSQQAIRLQAEEWTSYALISETPKTFSVTLRAKAQTLPAALQVLAGGQTQDLTISAAGWVELKLDPVRFSAGPNQLKIAVKQGTISLDWLQFQ